MGSIQGLLNYYGVRLDGTLLAGGRVVANRVLDVFLALKASDVAYAVVYVVYNPTP